jgi:hypothetical protein
MSDPRPACFSQIFNGDPMELRICEHCGVQFFTLSKSMKEDEKFFPIAMILFPLMAWFSFEMGGWWWLGVIFCVLLFLGAIMQKSERDKMKRGKVVQPSRACPSCDDSSADVDSPLGRQLILKWSDPSKMDPEFIDALRSIVSSADDADSSRRKQLIAKQPSPPAIDSQYIGHAPSIIPFVGDGDVKGVGDG